MEQQTWEWVKLGITLLGGGLAGTILNNLII